MQTQVVKRRRDGETERRSGKAAKRSGCLGASCLDAPNSSLCGLCHAVLIVLVLGLVGGCGGRRMRSEIDATANRVDESVSYLRNPGPRAQETAFSPLPMPDPDLVRLGSGAPGPEYWQQRVDYTIEATLDAENDHLTGRERVTYHNNSPATLEYIWLHLEQNLYRSDSVATLSSEPGARFTNRDFEGGYTISNVQTPGGEALEFTVHDVLGRIELPRPLEPGAAFEFELSWENDIPEYGIDRSGIERLEQGTIYEMAQWFPQVAVYDDYYGWNTLPYLGTGEFYSNFGKYDVKLTVPRNHILYCTGMLQNPEDVLTDEQRARLADAYDSAETVMIVTPEEVGTSAVRPAGDGPLTWHFVAEDVRTVAWASSEAFIWDASFLEDSGPESPRGGGPQGTLCMSLYPKEAIEIWSRSTEMLRFAIDGYNERWFQYPYPVATNVNGPVGGMEYPMIIFCRARRELNSLWGVTTHEIGHNWFPMVVNTDERRHAWMDEGFNTFINHYSDKEWAAHENEEFDESEPGRDMAEYLAEPDRLPIMTWHDQVRDSGATQYWKPAYALRLLREQILGPERFDYAFRTYIRWWAFKSPRPADFFRAMEDTAGADLSWFWRGLFYESARLDQEVIDVAYSEEDGRRYALVTFRNNLDMVMPVVFRVMYSDATIENRRLPVEVWFTTDQWTTQWPIEEDRDIVRIEVDPEYWFPDENPDNNVWTPPYDPNRKFEPVTPSAAEAPLPTAAAE